MNRWSSRPLLPTRCVDKDYDEGYSLLETLIALAILALGASITLPHFGLLKGQLIQLDIAGVIADLKTLRNDAMLTGAPTDLRATSFGYILEPGKIERRLRSGGRVTVSTLYSWDPPQEGQVVFYSDGSSTSGLISLQMDSGNVQITIDPLTAHGKADH